MRIQRTIRVLARLALAAIAACAAPPSPPVARPNEVQVVEPAGKEALWSYAPREIAVAKGTTITFVNKGKEFHTVTSDDTGRPFDVGMDSGISATVTFDRSGVYAYHCGVHPQMKGVVRVCEGPCT